MLSVLHRSVDNINKKIDAICRQQKSDEYIKSILLTIDRIIYGLLYSEI